MREHKNTLSTVNAAAVGTTTTQPLVRPGRRARAHAHARIPGRRCRARVVANVRPTERRRRQRQQAHTKPVLVPGRRLAAAGRSFRLQTSSGLLLRPCRRAQWPPAPTCDVGSALRCYRFAQLSRTPQFTTPPPTTREPLASELVIVASNPSLDRRLARPGRRRQWPGCRRARACDMKPAA